MTAPAENVSPPAADAPASAGPPASAPSDGGANQGQSKAPTNPGGGAGQASPEGQSPRESIPPQDLSPHSVDRALDANSTVLQQLLERSRTLFASDATVHGDVVSGDVYSQRTSIAAPSDRAADPQPL